MENTIEYKTLDLGEAAMLFCFGFEFTGFEPGSHERQRVFVFKNEHPDKERMADADIIASDYKKRRGVMVDAYDYFLSLKELKSRLHDEFEER